MTSNWIDWVLKSKRCSFFSFSDKLHYNSPISVKWHFPCYFLFSTLWRILSAEGSSIFAVAVSVGWKKTFIYLDKYHKLVWMGFSIIQIHSGSLSSSILCFLYTWVVLRQRAEWRKKNYVGDKNSNSISFTRHLKRRLRKGGRWLVLNFKMVC